MMMDEEAMLGESLKSRETKKYSQFKNQKNIVNYETFLVDWPKWCD